MKVRLIFHCPGCGSNSIRPSWRRSFGDPFLRILGVRPQRCRLCRSRFYLFNPNALRNFVAALNRPPVVAEDAGAVNAPLTPEAKRRRWIAWDPLRNNRLW
jgi:hypothetical protein